MSSSDKLEGSLFPIVPQSIGRYDVAKKVERTHMIIETGMFTSSLISSPTYLPPQWSSAVHPEGKLYFYRNSALKMVTEAYLYNPEVWQAICSWAKEFERRFEEKGFVYGETIEAFLQLSGDDCNYYIVDRDTQTVFWLEDCDTSNLGLLPVVSSSNLKMLLEAQFWTHTENFSMHFGGLPQKSIDDLILVISHALADNITSSLSTFPFDTATCQKFLDLLTSSRDRIHDGHTVTFVARIWGMIMYNRYETHYGQEQARLSRDNSILIDDDTELEWTKPIFSLASFRSADLYMKRLNTIFNDRFLYTIDWDSFMKQCISDWTRTGIMSSILLFLHIFCFFLPVSPTLAYVSGSISALSIITSLLAINRHQPLDKEGAAGGHDYLTAVCSPTLKFQGVAFAYALPKTLFILASIIFLSQWPLIIYQSINLVPALLCIILVSLVLAAFQYATSEIPFPRPTWSWRTRAEKDEAHQV
ncbi:hypothetical protein D9613_009952 [Agrocybe pediades]|uniref:WW domain-containing protein n=1 Tax=Agrocybe pediades TaxID=84607 RepID=A0A8H4VPZ8_9AGAR|nr:hypothetical protein D9613_009952 [Agrocybe pediades]